MRIKVGNREANIRETINTLWFPKRDKEVEAAMDKMYERVPNQLQWDKRKPLKQEPAPPPVIEPEPIADEPEPLEFDD